jgi:O-antigen/teichoic acid export membrane protein
MKKQILSNSIIYSGSSILIKAFNFFLLPLYTAYLTTSDYGTTSLVSSFTSIASFIFTFGLYSAVTKYYIEFSDDRQKVKRLFGTLIIFIFISGVFFSLLFFLLRSSLTKLIFENISFFPTVFIALIGLIFTCLYTVYSSILRAMQQAKKDAITSIFLFFIKLIFSILFVVKYKMGADGVLLAVLISYAIFFIYIVIDLIKNNLFSFCIDFHILKETLSYSIPLLPHNLSTSIANLVSNIFINANYSLSSVGLFSIGSQFGMIMDILQGGVNLAYTPLLFNVLKDGAEKKKSEILSITNWLLCFNGIFFLGISFFSQEVIALLTTSDYHIAWTVVPLVIMMYVVKMPYHFYIGILFYYKELSRKIFYSSLSAAILNIILSALLIPKWDMYGSAVADIIAMAVRVVIVVRISRNYEPFGYRIWHFVRYILITASFILIGILPSYLYFVNSLSIINVAFKLVIFALYIFVLWLMYKEDLRPLKSEILRFLQKRKGKSQE